MGDNSDNVTPLESQTETSAEDAVGLSDDDIRKYANNYNKHKAEMDETRGELGALVKQFEEDGGNKPAFKTALKISRMESSKAQDFWRSLNHYMKVLGVFDQADMFDETIAEAAE